MSQNNEQTPGGETEGLPHSWSTDPTSVRVPVVHEASAWLRGLAAQVLEQPAVLALPSLPEGARVEMRHAPLGVEPTGIGPHVCGRCKVLVPAGGFYQLLLYTFKEPKGLSLLFGLCRSCLAREGLGDA